MPVIAQITIALVLTAGGSLGLETASDPGESPSGDQPPRDSEPTPLPGSPILPGGIGLGASAALAILLSRREDLTPGDGLTLEEPPIVVFVPGHGQAHGSSAFADLVDLMGLDQDSTRFFDYRWVDGDPVATRASQHVPLSDAAAALNSYVAGVAEEGRPVYLVGFSKGGAAVAEMVADWDDGRFGPSEAVLGAALLDPPMARGPHGWLQSLGWRIGPVPDDGGYDPVQCRFVRLGCRDRRAHLGESSGVEVVVIRNPKAGITSFGDVPPGLRVYDAPDSGPTILDQLQRNPLALPGRIAAAHESVLRDRDVAACIVAEMRSGRCDLPRRGAGPRLSSLRRPAIRPPSGQRVL